MLIKGRDLSEAAIEALVEMWRLQAIKNGLIAERVIHRVHSE
jgi:hypothetical protein